MARGKKKLEEAISEILIADTDSENPVWTLAMLKTFEEEEEEQQQQQQQPSAEVTMANTGQRNHQPNCAAVFVLLAAKERAPSAPDMTWACVWCLVSRNITQK